MSLPRSVLVGAGRLWLYCLKRAVWLALLAMMASFLQLSFSQGWDDMGFSSGDMQEENGSIFPPCPFNDSCEDLPVRCISCDFNEDCAYGNVTEVSCVAREGVNCTVSFFEHCTEERP